MGVSETINFRMVQSIFGQISLHLTMCSFNFNKTFTSLSCEVVENIPRFEVVGSGITL